MCWAAFEPLLQHLRLAMMPLPRAGLASANGASGSVQWRTVLTNPPAATTAGQQATCCDRAGLAVVPRWPKSAVLL